MTNYLTARSSNLNTFNAININYSTLIGSTLSVSQQFTLSTMNFKSTTVSIGQSTNSTYATLANGAISTIGNWVNSSASITGTLSNISVVAMSANAQYQILQQSTQTQIPSLYLSSDVGQSWSVLSNASGLPAVTSGPYYTATALSASGKYGAVIAWTGSIYIYVTNNYGASFTSYEIRSNVFTANNNNYVAVSASGQYMLVAVGDWFFRISTNYGVSWALINSTPSAASWRGLAMSATGQYMMITSPIGTTKIAQPASSNNWTVNGITWTASASSNSSTAYQLFDGSNTTRWTSASNYVSGVYNNTNSTNVAGITVYGEWFQLYSPTILELYSYSFTVGGYVQYPKTFMIVGSYDGSNWQLIQSVIVNQNPSSVDNSTSALGVNTYVRNQYLVSQSVAYSSGPGGIYTCTYPVNIGGLYNYFRLIATSTFSSVASDAFSLNECYFIFNSGGTFYSTNYGTSWSNSTLQIPDALAISGSGQYALGVNSASGAIQILPQKYGLIGDSSSVAVATTTWTQNGVTWTSNASTIFSASNQPWIAYDNLSNLSSGLFSWKSSTNYTNGIANGNIATSVSSYGIFLGDWLQISTSVPLVLNSYNFACGNFSNMPKRYAIVGSNNNGTTWYLIQQANGFTTNPFTTNYTYATSANFTIAVNTPNQTMTAQASGTQVFAQNVTSALGTYNMFRIIAMELFTGGTNFELEEWFLSFTGASTTYYVIPNYLSSLATTSYTLGNVTGYVVDAACSQTGQYMVLVTTSSTSNVYYSNNYGTTFVGISVGNTGLTSCAISSDGSYITVSSSTTVYTLNNNSNGYSIAIGSQAGALNQGQNAVAIGSQAGLINQTSNSIIINASGTAVNSYAQGFYVAPIAAYTASSSQTFSLLGTSSDNQIVQISPTITPSVTTTGTTLAFNGALSATGTIYGSTVGYSGGAGAAFWMQSNGSTSLYITDSQYSTTIGTSTYGRYFGSGGTIFQDYFNVCKWRATDLAGNVTTDNVLYLGATGNVGIGTNSPGAKLHVNGNMAVAAGNMASNTNLGNWTSANCLTISSAAFSANIPAVGIGYNSTSDIGQLFSLSPSVAWKPMLYHASAHYILGGNVGIGTNNPVQALHIYGGTGRLMVESISASNNAVLQLKTNTNTSYMFTNQNGHLEIYTNNISQHILLQPSGGNIGIGTYNPTQLLTVYNGNMLMSLEYNIYLYYISTTNYASISTDSGGTMYFNAGTSGVSARLSINASGVTTIGVENISISQSSGQYRAINTSSGKGIIMRNDGDSFYLLTTNAGDPYGAWNAFRPLYFDLNNGKLFSNNGQKFLGTCTTDNLTVTNAIEAGFIEVTGTLNRSTTNGFYQYFFNSVTNDVGYQGVNFGGSCSIYAREKIMAINFYSYSDRRIKKNITNISNCLHIINKINIVSYNYIDSFKGNFNAYGVIAQDIYNIIPSAISKSTDIVPNIMKPALSISHINDYIRINIKTKIDENDDIKIGSTLILYINNSNKEEVKTKTKILYINYNDSIIHVEKWDNYNEMDKVFIYGTEVDDYLSVDKSALSILALKGVQELSQIITQQEEKIAAQQSQLDKLLQWAVTQGYTP